MHVSASLPDTLAKMLDREACERRVYRLATLLIGNPIAATKVIAQVVDAQPDLRGLDSAHMDRLTVLRSREAARATLASDLVPTKIASAVAALLPQQREAWVFSRVYQATDREMARAMDCSVTAAVRHRQQAEDRMTAALDPADAAAAGSMLLKYSMTLDVPQFYRAAKRRTRSLRTVLILIVAALLAILVSATLLWWSRPLGR